MRPEWQEEPNAFMQLRALVEVLRLARENHSNQFFWLTDKEEELLEYMVAAVATSKFAPERFRPSTEWGTTA